MFYHSTWGTVSRGVLTRRCGLGIAGLVLLTLVLGFLAILGSEPDAASQDIDPYRHQR